MDPITRAMQRFVDDAEAFWRAHPPRLLPLIAREDDRGWVLGALRLREAEGDNRRPIIVHQAPFEAASAYFIGLAAHIEEHYELVRKGVAEEGVELPAFASDEATMPVVAIERAASAAERAARMLGEGFDGIVIALVPERVGDVCAWREGVRALAAVRWSARVRFAVLAPPGGALEEVVGDAGARLEIDAGAMLEVASCAAANDSEETPSAKLRALMIEAVRKSAAGDHEASRELRERAVELCAAEQMPIEEAGVWISIATEQTAAQQHENAAASYALAATLAASQDGWGMACQAWLCAGGAHVAASDDMAAADAFQEAASAARSGGIVLLEIEALQLEGACLLRLGREADAARTWQEALDAGAPLNEAQRGVSALGEVAAGLARLRAGASEQSSEGGRAE